VALQILARPSAGLRVELHVNFGEENALTDDELSKKLDAHVLASSAAFEKRLSETFPGGSQQSAVKSAVSGLLGGLGHFQGRLLAKQAENEEELERLPAAVLFSGVLTGAALPTPNTWNVLI